MSQPIVPGSNPDQTISKANREALTSRVLPQMILSTGSEASFTAAPISLPPTTSLSERARLRFEVQGTAVITGGSGTLALSTSRALLEHGLSCLMILDLPASLIASVSKIQSLQLAFPAAKITSIAVDITDSVAVSAAFAETVSIFGEVNHLLCFAGVVDCTPRLRMDVNAFRRTIDINTTGAFICAQAFARQVVLSQQQENPTTTSASSGGSSIVFIASISGHRINFPQPQIAYNISKSALLTMRNCLAAEWARYGIRVNSISPGYMDTILNEGAGIAEARRIWGERNPMGRMGMPDELTGAVVLLSSSAGSYMTGTDIVVDGGQIVF